MSYVVWQAVLFSHPGDFTPVCTTELGEVARRSKDFEKRNVKVIGISANGLDEHERWVKDINAYGSKVAPTEVEFPIVCPSRTAAMFSEPELRSLDRRSPQEDLYLVRYVGRARRN